MGLKDFGSNNRSCIPPLNLKACSGDKVLADIPSPSILSSNIVFHDHDIFKHLEIKQRKRKYLRIQWLKNQWVCDDALAWVH